MAPPIEPKRRVKSIKKPGGKLAKLRRPKGAILFTKPYINKVIKKVLKRRADPRGTVPEIYRMYRRLVKMVCELVIRRDRSMTMKEAQKSMARIIPRAWAMSAIREFRQEARKNLAAPSTSTSDA